MLRYQAHISTTREMAKHRTLTAAAAFDNLGHLRQDCKMRISVYSLLISSSMFLCSCKIGDGDTPASAATKSALGVVEDHSLGLVGPDVNQNGIRDDIDVFIEKDFSISAPVKRAAQQNARALQSLMVASTRFQAIGAGDQVDRAGACIAAVARKADGGLDTVLQDKLVDELEAITANTDERAKAYLAANVLLNATASVNLSGSPCD